MKNIAMAAAAILVCACTPPAAETSAAANAEPQLEAVTLPINDRAGNRMEALTRSGDEWCSADGLWCVRLVENHWSAVHGALATTLAVSGEGEVGAWPVLIRTPNENVVYVGLMQTITQMYSGGGGSAGRVTIYEVTPADPGLHATPTITLPLSGHADVRACFDEDDERQRAGACHDQYTFMTRIGLDETVTEGAPRILLDTAAGSFPGRVTRSADSLEQQPLEQSDLVWARDETCSYHRVYTRGADGLYAPDLPLPGCSDYLEP
jgi:hypothetical protein